MKDSQKVSSEDPVQVENSGPSSPSRAAAKAAASSIVIGRNREAQVVMESEYPYAQVVTLDRLLDPHTGLVVEEIQPVRSSEEVDKEMVKARKAALGQ